MGINQQWSELATDLENNGYIFAEPTSMVLQIIYPDGIRSKKVSRSRESEILEILERAFSHLNMSQVLESKGYRRGAATTWLFEKEVFQDFRYAWLHYDERNYDVG